MIYIITLLKAVTTDANLQLVSQLDAKNSPNFISLGTEWWEFKTEIINDAIDFWHKKGKAPKLFIEDFTGFIIPKEW